MDQTADAGVPLLRLPRFVVARPRLEAVLDGIPAGGVGMVVALAGSGKSVLMRQWMPPGQDHPARMMPPRQCGVDDAAHVALRCSKPVRG